LCASLTVAVGEWHDPWHGGSIEDERTGGGVHSNHLPPPASFDHVVHVAVQQQRHALARRMQLVKAHPEVWVPVVTSLRQPVHTTYGMPLSTQACGAIVGQQHQHSTCRDLWDSKCAA
jgi:hypothetical protein